MIFPILLPRKKIYLQPAAKKSLHKSSASTGGKQTHQLRRPTSLRSHLPQAGSQLNSNRFQSKRALLSSAVTLGRQILTFDKKKWTLALINYNHSPAQNFRPRLESAFLTKSNFKVHQALVPFAPKQTKHLLHPSLENTCCLFMFLFWNDKRCVLDL